MSHSGAALRLVRDDGMGAGFSLEQQVDSLQAEIEALRAEVSHLRKRDDTVKYTMQRIDEELRLAARLQRDFMPKVFPSVPRVRFNTLFRPAGYVSGDLYDAMRLDEKHVAFYMADAVGHGMPAALLTMFVKHALVTKEIKAGQYRLLTPGETLARLNDLLVEQELSQATFATAVYGIINCETLELQFASAGHPAPLVIPAEGEVRALPGDGSLLGIFPGENFANVRAQLSPGDRLVVYTDGVEVGFNTGEHGEELATEQWREELESRRGLGTEELLREFAGRLDGQVGSMHPKDDLTIMMIDVG